jgi:hypothetical protein
MATVRGSRLISVGAETAAKTWLIEQLYGRTKANGAGMSKAVQKGVQQEGAAIRFLSDAHNDVYFKNETYYYNDYIKGTPDIITEDTVLDIKCSWDCFTFPLYVDELDKTYWWQMQGYMWLTGLKMAKVCYCLMDATEEQIEIAASQYCKANDCEYTEEVEDKVRAYFTYEGLDIKLRLKEYEVEYDQEAIDSIEQRVKDCRTYLEGLEGLI